MDLWLGKAFDGLRGHPDGVVFIGLAAIAGPSLAAGAPPVAMLCVVLASGFFYAIRCSAREAHQERMAQLKINVSVVRADVLRAGNGNGGDSQAVLPLRGRPGPAQAEGRRT